MLQELNQTDFEYRLVETAFTSTGKPEMDKQAAGGYGAYPGGGRRAGALLPHPKSPAAGRVLKIEKMFNPTIFDKFAGELRRQLKEYPGASVWDITRLLFHGSNQTTPSQIYASDYGLDMRFANAGMYGTGIYFANSSHYSRNYEHAARVNGRQVYQIFFCFVVVGESVSLSPQKLQVPPLKRDHKQSLKYSAVNEMDVYDSKRFDSVCN